MNNVFKVLAISLTAVIFAGCDSDEPEQTNPEIITNESMGSPNDRAMEEDEMEKKSTDGEIVIPNEGVEYEEK